MPKLTHERAKEVLVNRLDNLRETISNLHEFAERYEIVYNPVPHIAILDLNVCICEIIGAIEEEAEG